MSNQHVLHTRTDYMDYLKGRPYTTIQEFADNFDVSYSCAEHTLERYVSTEVLKRRVDNKYRVLYYLQKNRYKVRCDLCGEVVDWHTKEDVTSHREKDILKLLEHKRLKTIHMADIFKVDWNTMNNYLKNCRKRGTVKYDRRWWYAE